MRPVDAEAALRAAREARSTLTPFTDDDPTLDEDWGYDVQALDHRERVGSGETVIGAKLGLTSAAKQKRMNVNQPIVGFLTDTMRVEPDFLAQSLEGVGPTTHRARDRLRHGARPVWPADPGRGPPSR